MNLPKKYSLILAILLVIAVMPCMCQVGNFKQYKSKAADFMKPVLLSDVIGVSDPQKIIIYVPFQYFITDNDRVFNENVLDNYYNLIYGRKIDFGSIPHKTLCDKDEIRNFMASLDSMSYIGLDRSSDCGLAYRINAMPKRTLLGIQKTIPDFEALVLIIPRGGKSPVVVCQTGDLLIYNGYQFRIPNFYDYTITGCYISIFRELAKEGKSNIII